MNPVFPRSRGPHLRDNTVTTIREKLVQGLLIHSRLMTLADDSVDSLQLLVETFQDVQLTTLNVELEEIDSLHVVFLDIIGEADTRHRGHMVRCPAWDQGVVSREPAHVETRRASPRAQRDTMTESIEMLDIT